MTERRVQVRVSVQGSETGRELKKISGEALGTAAALKAIPNEVTVRANGRGFDDLDAKALRAQRSGSGLLQTTTALAPALLAVGAVGVPAVAGLATELGFTTAAAGTMLLAFNGVGDALKALDAYQLEPTAANLQKVHETMGKLGPDGQAFVQQLDQLEPRLKALKTVAENGVLPGASESIDDLLTRLPQLRRIIATVSSTSGDLLADAGAGLAGGGFDDFFDYLETDARPILTDTARAVGNLTEGIAHLFVDFAPQEQQFSGFLLNASRDFNRFADGLDETDGFQNFLDYLDDNGPRVANALGAIAGAVVSIARAAAPLSGPTLDALTAVARIVDEIASSPLGTPLVTLASGLALLNRAVATRDLARGSTIGQLLAGRTSGVDKARSSVRALRDDLRSVNSVGFFAGTKALAPTAQLERADAASKRLRGNLATVGKGAAALGAVAVASSGAADGIGLTNTASLALAGTMFGPWGTAVGAGAGLLLDLKAAGDSTADALERLDDAADAGSFSSLLSARSATDKAASGISYLEAARELATGSDTYRQLQDARAKNQKAILDATSSYRALAQLVGRPLPADASPNQILEFATQVKPALDKAGISSKDLFSGGYESAARAARAVQEYNEQIDGVPARTAAVGSAIEQIGLGAVTAAQGTSQLATSLNELITPGLNAEAAADQLAETFERMKKTLADNRGAGFGSATAKSRANDAATRDVASGIIARLSTAAEGGAGAGKLSAILERSRRQFIEEGRAAGYSRDEIVARANALGLTPKLVRTVLEAADKASPKVQSYSNKLNDLPYGVLTNIATNGVPRSKAQVTSLQRQYGLTPAQVRTLMSLKDEASSVIAAVLRRLAAANGKSARTTITTVQKTIYTSQGSAKRAEIAGAQSNAAGGFVRGPGGPRDDAIPSWLSNGEFVVNAAATAANRAELEWMNARRYANGGLVGSAPRVSVSAPPLHGMAITGRLRMDASGRFATLEDAHLIAEQKVADYADERGRDIAAVRH